MTSIPEDVYALGLELEGLEQAERTAQGNRTADIFGVCLQFIFLAGCLTGAIAFAPMWLVGVFIMTGIAGIYIGRLLDSSEALTKARAETESARTKFNEAVVQNTPPAS